MFFLIISSLWTRYLDLLMASIWVWQQCDPRPITNTTKLTSKCNWNLRKLFIGPNIIQIQIQIPKASKFTNNKICLKLDSSYKIYIETWADLNANVFCILFFGMSSFWIFKITALNLIHWKFAKKENALKIGNKYFICE